MSFTSTFPTNIVKFSYVAVAPVQVGSVDSAVGRETVSARIFVLSDTVAGIEVARIEKVVSDQGAGVEQVVSLSVKTFAKDYGYGGEVAQKTYAEILVIDQSKGIDRVTSKYMERVDTAVGAEVARVYLIALDRASVVEVVVEKVFSAFDKSTAIDRSAQKEMRNIADYSNGFEASLIALRRADVAIAREVIIFARTVSDIGRWAEKRLSPVPVKAFDVATTIDITTRAVKRRFDSATGVEVSRISILVLDRGTATDIVAILSRASKDSSAGVEKRLSPVPLARFDSSSGYERSWFGYREWLRIDYAKGADKVVLRLVDRVADRAIGADISKINKFAGDRGFGVDISISMSRLIRDLATFTEKRLSPIPLLRSDRSYGYDRAWFYWWEGKRSDSAVARERLVGKQMALPDIASTVEKALIGIIDQDKAAGIDRYTCKCMQVPDRAMGYEKRLSPIPVKTYDTAQGIEVIIYRYIEKPDAGIGIEAPILEAYLAPMSQSIASKILSSIHTGYSYWVLAQEAKTFTGPRSRGVTAFAASSTSRLESSFSTSKESSTFASTMMSNTIKTDESASTEKTEVPKEVAIQSISIDMSMSKEEQAYYETSLLNKIGSSHEELEHPDTFTSKIITDALMQSPSRALYRTYIPPMLLEEVGKLSTLILAGVSREQAFKTVEIGDKIILSSPPTIIDRANQFLTRVAEQLIIQGLLISGRGEQSFISKSIEQPIALSREQKSRETQALPAIVDEKLSMGLFRSTLEQVYREVKTTLGVIEAAGTEKRYVFSKYDAVEKLLYGLYTLYRFVTASYLYLVKLQELEKGFRYVKEGDEVLHTDHNIFVDAFQLFLEFAQKLTVDRFRNDVDVNNALEALMSSVSKLRRVRSLDIITPEDHNQIVECIERAREFIKIVRKKVGLEA